MSKDAPLSEIPESHLREHKAATLYDRIAELKIKDVETYALMGDLLKEVKRIVSTFEEETSQEISQAHKLHKALLAQKKRWSEKFEEAEKLAKEKMAFFYQKETNAGLALPAIDDVSFGETWTGEVVDESLIPRQYLVPDLSRLLAVTRSLKQATQIPGWRVKSAATVTVRS